MHNSDEAARIEHLLYRKGKAEAVKHFVCSLQVMAGCGDCHLDYSYSEAAGEYLADCLAKWVFQNQTRSKPRKKPTHLKIIYRPKVGTKRVQVRSGA